jgi:hypothetical protein
MTRERSYLNHLLELNGRYLGDNLTYSETSTEAQQQKKFCLLIGFAS